MSAPRVLAMACCLLAVVWLTGCRLVSGTRPSDGPSPVPPPAGAAWGLLFEKPDGVYLLPDGASDPVKLRASGEDDRCVSWDIAADGKHVALATANGDAEVLTLAPRGTLPLYKSSVYAGAFDWSPDSRTLAYVEGGALHLWADGQQRTLVYKCGVTDLAWSPDGKQIAYGRRASDDKDLGLWIVAAEGGEPRCLAKSTGDVFGASNMSWSPDGRIIAFLHSYEGGSLCFVRPDGSGYRPDVGPAWLPLLWLADSSAVVYDALEDEITSRGIWRCTPIGKPEAIVPSGTSSFDMATNGKLLVVTSPRESDPEKIVTVKLLDTPRAGAAASQAQRLAGTYANGTLRPDGERAAVWVQGEGDTGSLWLGTAGQTLAERATGVSQILGWVK